MNLKITLNILALTLGLVTASTAHGQLFGEGYDNRLRRQALERIAARELEENLVRFPEISTSADCATSFSPGNDGIFRRTPYCHRANPAAGTGFLSAGYDVPADFLTGFSEQDTSAKWAELNIPQDETDRMIQRQETLRREGVNSWFMGRTDISQPVEMLTILNLGAAKAWDKILACAGGNASRARDLYRTGLVGCETEAEIKSLLLEIRQSLPILANSSLTIDMHDPDVRMQAQIYGIGNVLRASVPRVPRMHPLLSQVMYEEFLTLWDASIPARRMLERLNGSPELQRYTEAMAVWSWSGEDRACSSYGLWPSANRAALEAMSNASSRAQAQVNRRMIAPRALDLIPVPCAEAAAVQTGFRLPSVYATSSLQIWNEVLAVRSLYVQPTQEKP